MKLDKILVMAALVAVLFVGCARYEDTIQTEIYPEPQLYQMAKDKYAQEAWDDCAMTCERYERLYADNSRVQEIRLLRADAYFKKNRSSSYILAKSEYQSFLALYPRYEKPDYIWLQIAKCSYQQILPPNRDQSYTKESIKDLNTFIERYPNSEYIPEARQLLDAAYKTLAEYHITVADHYYRRSMFPSAAERYKMALDLKVEMPDLEQILYRLVFSSAKTSDFSASMYTLATLRKEETMIEMYRSKYQRTLYESRQYLEDYKAKYPQNTEKINELQSQINMVKPLQEGSKEPQTATR